MTPQLAALLAAALLGVAAGSPEEDPARRGEAVPDPDGAAARPDRADAAGAQGAAPAAPGGRAAPPASEAPASKEEVRTLAEEIRRLKLDIGIPDVEYRSFAGLGPAASKVYYQPKGLSIGGYGEFVYQKPLDRGDAASDLLRAVLYTGYRFTPKILFNAEIEFEHAGHEVSVEFAYLDFLFTDALRLRVGNLLVPIGILNELHEPPFFNGVFRNSVETLIIPTTWHENGVGLHGELAGLRYKAYLLAGLDPIGAGGPGAGEPVTAGEWLRRARTGGAESRTESFAGVLNLVYERGPATVGGTIYHGRAGQGRAAPNGETIHANVTIAELHAMLAWRGFQARALVTQGNLGDAGLLSEALGLSGPAVLGSRVRGGYLEAGYDVLSPLGAEQSLVPFVRWERMNLHDQVPAGGAADPALKFDVVTAGLGYKPIPSVVVKADYQWRRSDAPADATSSAVNLGAGFVF